jgi:hypothetical protein
LALEPAARPGVVDFGIDHADETVDAVMGAKEKLCLPICLEALYLPFSFWEINRVARHHRHRHWLQRGVQ